MTKGKGTGRAARAGRGVTGSHDPTGLSTDMYNGESVKANFRFRRLTAKPERTSRWTGWSMHNGVQCRHGHPGPRPSAAGVGTRGAERRQLKSEFRLKIQH